MLSSAFALSTTGVGGDALAPALLTLSGSEELLRAGVQSSVQSTLKELSAEGVLQSGLQHPEHGDELDVTMTGYKMLFYKAALQVLRSSPCPFPNSETDVVALLDHCPSALYTFYDLWRRLVPPIRALSPESRLLLRNVILCGEGMTDEGDDVADDNSVPVAVPVAEARRKSTESVVSNDLVVRPSVAPARKSKRSREPEPSDSDKNDMQTTFPDVEQTPGIKWTLVKPTLARASKDRPPPISSEIRPHIWISSRQELCQALPELEQLQHNIAFEQTETPVLFLDGPKYIVDEWDGGKRLRLVFTRRYRFYPDQNAHHIAALGVQHDGVSSTASDIPERSRSVVLQDGLFLFPQGPIAKPRDTRGLYRDTTVASDSPPVLPVSDAPPEILALLHARESKVPVSAILCRNASISPFTLPEGCGCAYLGFFFITQLKIETIELTEEDSKGLAVYGTRHWTCTFEWTPGGEDPHACSATKATPWWMKEPEASVNKRSTDAEEPGGTPLAHAFTLLPSHLSAPSSQFGSSAQGWCCHKCGRINAQRNLCLQQCAFCSMSNGLAPMRVEYARDVRGTDPTTFPMDKCDEWVRRSTSDAPDGLRDFTYALSDSGTALVHHLFTRNHAHLQAVPTQLFHEIQAQVEMPGTPGAGVGRHVGQTVYSIEYPRSSPSNSRNAKAKGKGKESAWPSDTPDCVSRARELMLRRGQLPKFTSDLSIDHLTITAWRRSGNKKGCKLSARHAPVIILALGADVDLSFTRVSEAGVSRAKQTGRAAAPKGKSASRGISEDMDVDGEDAPEPMSLDDGPVRKKARTAKSKDDMLVVTLFHGDMLVIEGGMFEYSMKRSGMSMLLFGSQE